LTRIKQPKQTDISAAVLECVFLVSPTLPLVWVVVKVSLIHTMPAICSRAAIRLALLRAFVVKAAISTVAADT
jgi:hypothetical protein